VPAHEAMIVPLITPPEVMVKQGGKRPLVRVHVYGAIPPEPASVTAYADPTELARPALTVVIEGAAGTVIVAVPVLAVSAADVAVIVAVCAELVAAGAV
jgi:Zn-dependent protease